MADVIYLDESGKEVKRETKGRGRPPRGAVKQDNGNFVVQLPLDEPEARVPSEEIVLDVDGNVVSRKRKSRGRAKPGYVKHTEGEFSGHWVFQRTAANVNVESNETPTVVEEPTTETV